MTTKFYPEVKPHISPSALMSWHNQRSNFIRSYFKNEKTPETSAMKAGTKIHALIEAGFIEAKNVFSVNEDTLTYNITEDILVLGKPDSYEFNSENGYAEFVDYKTGKNDGWTNEKLAVDLKMRTTAYLVWKKTNEPESVKGYLEWIGTEWNGSEIVPSGEGAVYEYTYSADELKNFESVILKTIDEVNAEYLKFLSVGETVLDNEDIEEYVRLENQKAEIEEKQNAIKERVADILTIAGQKSAETPFGTFYFTDRKKYEYPDDLEFETKSGEVVSLAYAKEVALGAGVAKKMFEAENDPVSVSKSFSFRAKKPKQKWIKNKGN